MKKILVILMLVGLGAAQAQDTIQNYIFTPLEEAEVGEVQSQGSTGTCWSYSCHSFLESEMARMDKPMVNLSEMYAVYYTYLAKAENYVRRHGKANFDEGSLGHDVINVLGTEGAVLESSYSGLLDGSERHDHGDMVKALKKYLKKLLKRHSDGPPANWQDGVKAILNEHLGTPPASGGDFGLNADDYVSFTSFSHHPYYRSCVVEVPDNWSNGSFYNLPIDELNQLVMHALKNGYTLTWDGDVSETGFSARKSLAVLPANTSDEGKAAAMNAPGKERNVSQEDRQSAFDAWKLTDDHLMHITGVVKDQNGNIYYEIKNSWGKIGPGKGYLYMSEAYFRYGTVSILLHKDGVPADIKAKLGM
ncbi:MAG: C1 family peptidase [Bacteroidia bacterium]